MPNLSTWAQPFANLLPLNSVWSPACNFGSSGGINVQQVDEIANWSGRCLDTVRPAAGRCAKQCLDSTELHRTWNVHSGPDDANDRFIDPGRIGLHRNDRPGRSRS